MSFKNMKRDDHGHVIGNDEVDGQECKHGAGGSKPQNTTNKSNANNSKTAENLYKNLDLARKGYSKEELASIEAALDEGKSVDDIVSMYNKNAFDDDYDEEFDAADEEYNREMKKAQEENVRKGLDLQDAINMADDDVLDEEFGKDTPERKLVGAIKEKKPQESSLEKYNRMVGLESQMHSKIDNARKNGQSPQQVLDSVAYDMDLQPGTEEYDRLKTLVMYDTRMNKDTGSYEYNKYNSGSNKQVSGDERKKLQDLSDAFNKAGLENELKDTWEDYGARMGMTNLIHNNTQVLNPRDWMDYMNGNASAEDIIQRIKDSPYKSVFKWKEPLSKPEDFAKKTAKMPNGKEMSLFDFAHNIVNYLDTDTASAIIAAKYGVSENDAKAYLESPYNTEGSKKDYERKLKNSRG